ncbi:hypothetical protein [Streptomyces sp. NPDC093261]|uniref:hypothetical protein n=1 Tax=Streptomyces sp. NPDC093261 TaxID=3366037 RepID=UPI0037FF532A
MRAARLTVTLPVESEDVADAQLTAPGPEVEVLSPPGLRARLARDALRIVLLYGPWLSTALRVRPARRGPMLVP